MRALLNRYDNLNDKHAPNNMKQQGAAVINAIRSQNVIDQHFLCAYCCCEIRDNQLSAMNEHVEARSRDHLGELDFTNIVASCTTKEQCDDAHGSQSLFLTPLMVECETELKFRFSGKVEGLTDRAKTAISVLNLGDERQNNRSLIEKRRRALQVLLFDHGVNKSDDLNDLDELISDMLDEIVTPSHGKLAPYAPVLANILRNLL